MINLGSPTYVSVETHKIALSERLLNISEVRYLGSGDYYAFINKDINKTEIFQIDNGN